MSQKIVYIVHAIDTEGPLAETSPKFDMNLGLDKSWDAQERHAHENFDQLIEQHRKNVLGSWHEIVAMLKEATSTKQRESMIDDFGNGWFFNWFCIDHVGYLENPRGRAMGIHKIFDFYSDMVTRQQLGDGLHWHFHPMSTYKEAHKCATSYLNSPNLWEILCRRVIERKWFPIVNRAGFQDERPDSHWFLEQWIPFDLSNTASDDFDPKKNPDMVNGRFSDWRWAPNTWEVYHPHHDCHQLVGNCRRMIGRCLNLINRFANLTKEELDKAFLRAEKGHPTLVGLASHDWRNLIPELQYAKELIASSKKRFPDVKVCFSEAKEAFRKLSSNNDEPAVQLKCEAIRDATGNLHRIEVEAVSGKIFGPQPFLAIETKSKRFLHDNFNYTKSLDTFNYVFDSESVHPDDVKSVGIAANDRLGNQSIHTLEIAKIPLKPNAVFRF